VVRRRAFATVPERLDGTGATVIGAVDELIALIERAAAPLGRAAGERGGRARGAHRALRRARQRQEALEERHKRELRRYRADELRAGLGAMAAVYRDALVSGSAPRPDAAVDAVSHIHHVLAALERNPNEGLLLQALLWSLPPLPTTARA
jgi:hypothetical protein